VSLQAEAEPSQAILNAATYEPVELSMQHLHLAGRASPAGALLQATHRFKCKGDKPQEVLYTFMLPRQGTLRRFVVKGKDFEVESKLSKREAARQEYEDGLEGGHLSVLAETSLDGMVTLSIGQIRPDEEVAVVVEVAVGVEVEDGLFRFRYPFTLAPNYHPQATMSDGKMELPSDVFGDLILPEWKEQADGLHQVSFHLHVEAGGKLGSVGSPSHRVEVKPNDDGSAEVFLAGNNDVPNRDLVVDVKVREAAPTLFVDKRVDVKLPKGAARWTALIPSSCFARTKESPRRVCFLLDRSYSMNGVRLERAKAALDAMLAGLAPEDEFGLVHFGSNAVSFGSMCKASDSYRAAARSWLNDVHANGGTELALALGEAVKVLGGPGGDIFLLTDGEVFQTGPVVEQAAASGTRIHTLGIGETAQDRFLESLSRRTHGISKMTGVNEDVAGRSLELFSAVRQPVQMDATVVVKVGKKSQTHSVKTVWEGRPVLLTDNGTSGRGRPVSFALKCEGVKTKTVKLTQTFTTPPGLSAVMWAGRKAGDLETALDMATPGSESTEAVHDELESLSDTFGLASRAMSLCAVVKREGDQAGEQPEQRVVPVGLPCDMDSAMLGGHSFALRRMAMDPTVMNYAAVPVSDTLSYDGGGTVRRGLMPDSESFSLGTTRSHSRRHLASESRLGGSSPIRTRMKVTTKGGLEVPTTTTLISEVAQLKGDGGMPGSTEELRFAKTVVLALALLQADVDAGTAMYSTHRERIAKYIESHAVKGDAWMAKLIALLRAGTAKVDGDWTTRYQSIVGASKMGTPEKHEDYVAVLTDARAAPMPEV